MTFKFQHTYIYSMCYSAFQVQLVVQVLYDMGDCGVTNQSAQNLSAERMLSHAQRFLPMFLFRLLAARCPKNNSEYELSVLPTKFEK